MAKGSGVSWRRPAAAALAAAVLSSLTGCETLTDDRIPNMPVSINILGHGLWNTWGVSAYGQNPCEFIIYQQSRQPAGFPWTQTAATGYGGVLLICGQDPFTLEVGPLAYDLSCPVERKQTVRVIFDAKTQEMFCPECGSRYNVCERGGSPTAGPALRDHYQLKMYTCLPPADNTGGYMIINRR